MDGSGHQLPLRTGRRTASRSSSGHHRRPYRACFHADAHIAVSVSPPARRYERLPEEEIRRLWATVWVLPAILPEEGPGASSRVWVWVLVHFWTLVQI